eukprot:CAMPEP_0206134734 /NCGR_PEP_ID=MMETSP1473-20131121/179_1 /ASSEMBLY_ACC=CAM_ASM_001109 /TAXON_ID=1461547 /ORGANISM="Stichococcus sp, Strain RCC1054" /LENGTH=952 /DNA_ID=CAMNT_0053526355 /DNA_START=491 /DNA_END=3349 /DNA_ORIENTATION=+
MRNAAAVLVLASGVGALVATNASPPSWAVASLSMWSTYVLCCNKADMQHSWLHVLWAYASAAAFVAHLQSDPGLHSWADVYYFCSSSAAESPFCTCDMKWTWMGYLKLSILWNFVLSAALGVQKLVVTFLLDGLLQGEEVVTKESFVSVCWRLIPYWLNNWESDWGAECSSALFELPHFAMELLVVLPTVQILCSRLRILVLPQLRIVVPEEDADMEEIPREDLAPNIMRGYWQLDPHQRGLWGRLRAHKRVMLIMVGVAALAAANATLVPTAMEGAVLAHPRSWVLQAMPVGAGPLPEQLDAMQTRFLHRTCPSSQPIRRGMQKHAAELRKMAHPSHMFNLPLIEIALAIMRLSCEKFFVLASVFCAFLLFKEPPLWVRHIISAIANLSSIFQKAILYTFPAICWAYNAGFLFSTFVTGVFWTGPFVRLLERVRMNAASVRPERLTAATPADIERMDNKCAICWAEFGPAEGASGRSGARTPHSLPCSHAFHEPCIVQWLRQCHSQGRAATCPMCSATVQLTIQWRLPFGRRADDEPPPPADSDDEDGGGDGGAGAVPGGPGGGGMFPEIQALIEDMDDVAVIPAAPQHPRHGAHPALQQQAALDERAAEDNAQPFEQEHNHRPRGMQLMQRLRRMRRRLRLVGNAVLQRLADDDPPDGDAEAAEAADGDADTHQDVGTGPAAPPQSEAGGGGLRAGGLDALVASPEHSERQQRSWGPAAAQAAARSGGAASAVQSSQCAVSQRRGWEDDASSVEQLPPPGSLRPSEPSRLDPWRHQEPWQRQLSSGLSFGTAPRGAPLRPEGPAPQLERGIKGGSRSPDPRVQLPRDAASSPANGIGDGGGNGGRGAVRHHGLRGLLPFTGRSHRLGGTVAFSPATDSEGGPAGATRDAAARRGNSPEPCWDCRASSVSTGEVALAPGASSEAPPRSVRQRFTGRWRGQSAPPAPSQRHQ